MGHVFGLYGMFWASPNPTGTVAARLVPQHAGTCWEALFQHFPISLLCKEFGVKNQCRGLRPGSIPPFLWDAAELLPVGAGFWDCMGIAQE